MNFIKDLENTISIIYETVDKDHQVHLEKIIGGCHCSPATEWLGDVWVSFQKLLSENAISDASLEAEMKRVVSELSKTFGN